MSPSAYYLSSQDFALDFLPGTRQAHNDRPDVVLKLMPFSEHVSSVLAYLSHSRETASPDDDPPFAHNPDLTILTLFFHIDIQRPGSAPRTGQFLLIASVGDIVRTLDRVRVRTSMDASQPPAPPGTARVGPRILEWDEWDPPSTRPIGLRCRIWNDVPATSRTRCAVAFQGTASGAGHSDYLVVITAHPHAALRAAGGTVYMADEEKTDAETASFLVYRDVFTVPDVFREPVRSTLPVRVLCRRLPRPHDPAPYIGIGLFEDGLSTMYVHEPDSPILGEMFMFCV